MQAGRAPGQKTDVAPRRAQMVEVFALQHGQGERHVDGPLFLLARGHDYFVQFAERLGHRSAGHREAQQGRGGKPSELGGAVRRKRPGSGK